MDRLRTIFSILVIPLLILDMGAGAAGGLWLALEGAWIAIITGFGASFVALSVISAVPLPLLAPDSPEDASAGVGAALRSLILLGVMGAWAVGMFAVLHARAGGAAAPAVALWSYATATGAWMYLAQRLAHSGNGAAAAPAFFNQIGSVSLVFYVLTHAGEPAWREMAVWYGAPAFACLIAQMVFAFTARVRAS